MGSSETSHDSNIEEGCEVYHPRGFCPVYIGDIFNGRYRIFNRIGYSVYSIVWLLQDAYREKGHEYEYLALKIPSAECYFTDHFIFEREILRHLRDGNTGPLGHSYICHLLDDFEHRGPNGTHVCLVFPLMGETLRSFGAWFKDSLVPYSVMRRFTIQTVLALDYAHDRGVIHTDTCIQPNNIFVRFRDYTLIARYLQERKPMAQNREELRYTPTPPHSLRNHYFAKEDGTRLDEFDVALGDWGVASWKTKHLSENIQPVALRAPEVLIKATWDTPTDWWNLGAVLLEVYRAVRMFDGYAVGPADVSGRPRYELRQHLAEIVDFFGPFPRSLLDKGDAQIVQDTFCEDGTVRGYPPQLDRPGLASEKMLLGQSGRYPRRRLRSGGTKCAVKLPSL